LPYNHPHYDIVFDFANEHHLPILAHTFGADLGVNQLEPAFGRYRNIHWLLAHTGSQDLPRYIAAATAYEHVFLETCLSACPRGLIEKLVQEVALEKIIWGSDQPFISASHQIGRVLMAQITAEQKRAILGQNAQRALRINE
jgi:predicted TIM-barrel fold metal-dependent hydrolase